MRSRTLLESTLFLTSLIGSASALGCVATDRCFRDWELQSPPGRAEGREPGAVPASGQSESAGRLVVGMTKNQVRAECGALIDECSEYVWKLRQQFRPVTPGTYPLFDSRQVYLYFDGAEHLIAINVRGSYSVYP